MPYRYIIFNPIPETASFPAPPASLTSRRGRLDVDCGGCQNKSVSLVVIGPIAVPSGNVYEVQFDSPSDAQTWRDENLRYLVGMTLYGVHV